MKKDNTASIRQRRRKERLADQGLYRKSLIVHEKCNVVFDNIKPYFADPKYAPELENIFDSITLAKPINVSKVRQLSPFRYPGGKTWLVPEIKKWIYNLDFRPSYFIEPFAGGAIASLSVAAEDLAEKVIMSELDPDVAAVWYTILNNPDYLCARIQNVEINLENVRTILASKPDLVEERAFITIVKNRTQRGGILAPGASLIKSGENGKGLLSRWYPETLIKRINAICKIKDKIQFHQMDGLKIISRYKNLKRAVFFVDPPYTAGGKNAGK